MGEPLRTTMRRGAGNRTCVALNAEGREGLYLPALDAAGDMIEISRSIAIVATKIIIARDKASQYSFDID